VSYVAAIKLCRRYLLCGYEASSFTLGQEAEIYMRAERKTTEEAYSGLVLQAYEESRITQHGGLSRVTDRDAHGQTFDA
jgi:hypothetical protein